MTRTSVVVCVVSIVALNACSAVANVLGAPKVKSVTISAPAGILLGESAVATADVIDDEGKSHPGWERKWSSSNPAALSIDATGKMTGLIAGQAVTITAEVNGAKGSANVFVASDDSRFGYALADQPTNAGPYTPADGTRYNSGGGAVDVTRASDGVYSVRFAGLGRTPGQHDNAQVSAYNAGAMYCKPDFWDASSADLVVTVRCFAPGGIPTDSKFTVMALGAWAFGKTTPIAFVANLADSSYNVPDSSVTMHNSSGGLFGIGHVETGRTAMNFKGQEAAWASAPAAIQVSPLGTGPRRCRLAYVDPTAPGVEIDCYTFASVPGDATYSFLWLQHGRPSMRFGFMWANNAQSQTDYTPAASWRINSSGGTVTARKTAAGQYRVVFAGLGRPAGGTETVFVQTFMFADGMCAITSWGNTGVNDLLVNVGCYLSNGTPTDTQFSVLVVQ